MVTEEAVLRALTSAIIAIGTLLASAPAPAQTYDPNHPFCMHVYGEEQGERMDCIFPSLELCKASASGLPAICLVNPYYVHEATVTSPRSRRSHARRGRSH